MKFYSNLEYGSIVPNFPIPEDFNGVRPVRWVCSKSKTKIIFDGTGLIYILSGSGTTESAASTLSYQPNMVIGHTCSLLLTPCKETRYVYLALEDNGSLLNDIDKFYQISEDVGFLLIDMYQNALNGMPKDIYTASLECYSLLMALHRIRFSKSIRYSNLVFNAINIIREEYAYIEGIDELADSLEVSKSHLVRRFSAETGRGPGRYLQEVRLESARQLLLGFDYDIELISGMCGYSCANYFCKVFRRKYGLSPGAYRSKYRKDSTPAAKNQWLQEIDNMLSL